MRYLVLLAFLLPLCRLPVAEGAQGAPKQAAGKAVWYVAALPESPEGMARISLAIKLEKRGNVYQFTGKMGDPSFPGRQIPVQGTWYPGENRLRGSWVRRGPAGERIELEVNGRRLPDGKTFEVHVELVSLGPAEAVFLCKQSAAPSEAGGKARSTGRSATYRADRADYPGNLPQTSLTLDLEQRGKLFGVTGTLRDPSFRGRPVEVHGTWEPKPNRLTGSWELRESDGERARLRVNGKLMRDGTTFQVQVDFPGLEHPRVFFLCRQTTPGSPIVTAKECPELGKPDAGPPDGRWWGLVEVQVDPHKLSGTKPWSSYDGFRRHEQGTYTSEVRKDRVTWHQTWDDGNGKVIGEWKGTWTFDPPPAILRSDGIHRLKVQGTCEVLKVPEGDSQFACWCEARYDTNKNELHPERSWWNEDIEPRYPTSVLGHARLGTGGLEHGVPGDLIKTCESTYRITVGDSWSETWAMALMSGSAPEFLLFKEILNTETLVIYKYKFHAKPIGR